MINNLDTKKDLPFGEKALRTQPLSAFKNPGIERETRARGALAFGISMLLLGYGLTETAASSLTILLIGASGLLLISIGASDTGRVLVLLITISVPLLSVQVGWDTRAAALIPLGVIYFDKRKTTSSIPGISVPLLLGSAAVVVGASAFWAKLPDEAITGAQALALLTVATAVVPRRVQLSNVVKAGLLWSGSLTAVGLITIFAGLSFAERGGRGQGLLGNANGAAIVALFLVCFALLLGRRHLVWALPLAVSAIALAQSRAAALSLIVLLSVVTFGYLRHKVGVLPSLIFLSPLLVLSFLFTSAALSTGGGEGLLRTNDSREDTWEILVNNFQQAPLTGFGWGNQTAGAENFFLAMPAQLGVMGIALAIGAVLVLFNSLRSLSIPGLAIALAVVVNSVFEGWLLVGGSAYAWVTWLLVATSSGMISAKRNSTSRPTEANSRL